MRAPLLTKVSILKVRNLVATGAVTLAGAVGMAGQAPAAAAAPHASGTVKATADGSITVTTATGDYTVTVPATAKILDVPPGAKDLKSATPGQASDIAVGDKVIVNGSAGDTGTTLTAQRVILMKAAAIEQSHAADEAAWKNGGGGIVKSVNASAGTIVLSSGLKTVTVTATPATIVRHYSGESVRFEDAVASSLGAIQPGDQLRIRGTKSADGSSIQADEIVAGTFRNFSGLIASIDGTAGTVTLKDLTTKKTVTVAVTPNSDVRRVPMQMANMIAARMKADSAGGAAAARPAGDDGARRAGRAGADLSQMIPRLPTETLGDLKAGEAVMIVAIAPAGDAAKLSAVTLLTGVDPILTASPSGETTLSPWAIGGAPGGEGGGM
jgi:hypothetical protein